MKDMLSQFERIELVVAVTAEIGIRIVRELRPDLVIMDINLPGMNGVEAAKCMQEWPETRGIPVVALSAAATIKNSDWVHEAGFASFLTKPVQIEALTETLEQLLLHR
jgi:CheY-like chemotaxis protein